MVLRTDIMSLIRKRGGVKSSLTRLENYINDTNEPTQHELSARIQMLSVLFERFNSIQDDIEKYVSEEEMEDEEGERANFETKYLTTLSKYQEAFGRIRTGYGENNPNTSTRQ